VTILSGAAADGFSATDGGARWTFDGRLTIDTAAAAVDRAHALPLPATGIVDFSGMHQADSAALAVMLALKRRGIAERRPVTLSGMPPTLASLAVVYGVDALLRSA
jgi:ABC-type transporter Mla MlaB component